MKIIFDMPSFVPAQMLSGPVQAQINSEASIVLVCTRLNFNFATPLLWFHIGSQTRGGGRVLCFSTAYYHVLVDARRLFIVYSVALNYHLPLINNRRLQRFRNAWSNLMGFYFSNSGTIRITERGPIRFGINFRKWGCGRDYDLLRRQLYRFLPCWFWKGLIGR